MKKKWYAEKHDNFSKQYFVHGPDGFHVVADNDDIPCTYKRNLRKMLKILNDNWDKELEVKNVERI